MVKYEAPNANAVVGSLLMLDHNNVLVRHYQRVSYITTTEIALCRLSSVKTYVVSSE